MTGVLGGTFDPVHEGHIRLAQAAYDALKLDKLLFVPAYRNPLKTSSRATSDQRVEMLRRAIAGEKRKFEICELEVHRPGPSFTVDTLRELQKRHPGNYTFILGHEVFRDFPRWKEPGAILALADLALIRRPGAGLADVETVLGHSGVDFQATAPGVWQISGGHYIRDTVLDLLEYASTDIRLALAALPPEAWESDTSPLPGVQRTVWLFIKEFRLYTVS
ncbi:nicotinate (nicotinamide) nucleotide adenylyltransferase [bacterium]|nr:nicotinate (nicotinamide) nucleotide adenylyltransferase [bacterium]